MGIASLPIELAFSLRRAGFPLSTAQALDLGRALALVGVEDPEVVREATRAVCVTTPDESARFDDAFDAFFFAKAKSMSFFEELRLAGFSPEEIDAVRSALEVVLREDDVAFGALVHRGVEHDRLLTLIGEAGKDMRRLGQLGQTQERASERTGLSHVESSLAELERRLSATLGARARAIVDLLREKLRETRHEVRAHLRKGFDDRTTAPSEALEGRLFSTLDEKELDDVRQIVRRFGERLRGRELVRKKRAKRGRIDPAKTLREAMRTSSVPVRLVRKRKHRDKPRLVLLCDVSDSVRSAAIFMLEFVAVAHELFADARSFVFVSELAETTELFREEPMARALARIASGELVSVRDNSNYGRALRAFNVAYGKTIDRRSTVVVLGDARTNYSDPGVPALAQIRARAGHVVWLCPEKKEQWGAGDSAIMQYQPHCSRLLEVANVEELEGALRFLGTLRSRR